MMEITDANPENPCISIFMLLTNLATALIQKNVKVTVPVTSTLKFSLMNKDTIHNVRMARIVMSMIKAPFRYHFSY